jgi:hypothetical protein
VGDVLTKMLRKGSEGGLIKGLLPQFREGGVVSLQYADDTIIFSDPSEYYLKNLKCSLVWFENMSGMRINYHKSELIPCNLSNDQIHNAAHIFGCPVGSFPIKYLGVPLHYDKLRREDIQPLVDNILKRVGSWRGKLLSHAAKITLIQSCLASVPVYLLSFIKFPKWAIKVMNAHFANCLWSDSEGKNKYHLVKWDNVSMLKEFGGLGIPSLRDLNTCLLASWVKRYQADRGKIWRDLIDFKYKTDRPNIFDTKDANCSHFFKGFMWAARAAKVGFRWKVGDGRKIKFWEDNWLGSSSLAIQFWDLYSIVNEKTSTIAELWDGHNLKCTFKRTVSERLGRVWLEIVQLASTITFSEEEDALIWSFSSNGIYTSQSLYRVINFRGVKPVYTPSVWSLKIPPRIHFFLWLLSKNKNLTRDNLAKRQKVEDMRCLFCEELESCNHVFFECVVAKEMWSRISSAIGRNVGNSFESIGICWLSNRKFAAINILSSAALWAMWKLRNALCFQNFVWQDMRKLLMNIVVMAQNWIMLCPPEKKKEMECYIKELIYLAKRPEMLKN